jgi:hypothetical protein
MDCTYYAELQCRLVIVLRFFLWLFCIGSAVDVMRAEYL